MSGFDVVNDDVVEMVLLENPFRTPNYPGLKVVIACKGLDHVRRILNDNPPPGGVDVTMNNAKLLDIVDAHIVQKAISRQPGYVFYNWYNK